MFTGTIRGSTCIPLPGATTDITTAGARVTGLLSTPTPLPTFKPATSTSTGTTGSPARTKITGMGADQESISKANGNSTSDDSDVDKPSETADVVIAVLGAGFLVTLLILAAVAFHWRKSTSQATPFALKMANTTTGAHPANQVDYSTGSVPHIRAQDGDLYDEVAATVAFTGLPATVAETSFTGAGQAGQ